MRRPGLADITPGAYFEEEVVVLRRKLLTERQCHRMVVDGEDVDAVEFERAFAHNEVGTIDRNEGALEFIERSHDYRP